jgi:hypothetical protein
MSTRIGWAFVIGSTDAAELSRMTQDFRDRLGPIRLRDHARLLASRTCMTIDRAIALDREWTPNALSKTYGAIDDAGRESDMTHRRAVAEDFAFSISLIPDGETSSTYGMLHSERTDWKSAWMRLKGVRPFSWQDSTDRPKNVTRAEWDRREAVWDRIMPTGVPARHGFCATLFGTRIDFPRKNAMRLQPTLETRRLAIARERYVSEACRRAGIGRDMDFGVIMKASAHISGSAGRDELARMARDVILPRRITDAIARAEERPCDDVLDLVGSAGPSTIDGTASIV